MNSMDEFMKEYGQYIITNFSTPFPVVIVKGEDVYLTDMMGKKYLDFWAGIATMSAGHSNPKILEAVKKQMDSLVHCASQSY